MMLALFITLVAFASANPLSSSQLDDLQSELGKVKEVRSLLENLLEKRTEEVQLNQRVGKVVERVFFSRSYIDDNGDDGGNDGDDKSKLQSRAWTRPTEGQCSNGERFTCKNNLCDPVHTRKCDALCDAFPLGPNRERYNCRCKPSGRGLYCNVTETNLCKKNCQKPDRCYEMNASLSGYFCYSHDWKKLRNPNDIRERSVSDAEDMGRFAEVVDTIMRRQQFD